MSWLPSMWTIACAAGAALAGAGCGEAAEDSGRPLRVDAAPGGSLRFARSEVRAAPGRVEVEMANPSGIPHAIGIRGNGIEETGETVGQDGISRVSVDLERGAYVIFCPVGGHEAAGMTAALTVR